MYSYDMSQIIVLGNDDFAAREPAIKLYPNPSDGWVNIQHSMEGNGTVRILDMQGRIVQHLHQGELSEFNGQQQLFGLFSGVYFVQFQQGGTQQVVKLVIR